MNSVFRYGLGPQSKETTMPSKNAGRRTAASPAEEEVKEVRKVEEVKTTEEFEVKEKELTHGMSIRGAESGSGEDAACLWAPDVNVEWINATAALFHLSVLDQFGVFKVATSVSADIAAGKIVPKDARVACEGYDLNLEFAKPPPITTALSYASSVYAQVVPYMRARARTLCEVGARLKGAEGAEVFGLSREVLFRANESRLNLQVAASHSGIGIAKCVADQVHDLAQRCTTLLGEPSLWCACGVYDATDLFDQRYGQNQYPEVCQLLYGAEKIMKDAASEPLGDTSLIDYKVHDDVVDAGMTFFASDQALNPTPQSTALAAAPRPTATSVFQMALGRSSS
jgi:hypothetical protein